MGQTVDIGKRIELVPMDPHFPRYYNRSIPTGAGGKPPIFSAHLQPDGRGSGTYPVCG